jgi:uncharacterized protein YdaU (DUF1376 family)
MLDWCYLHEKPLPLDANEIARIIRLRDHAATIRDVLNEFFSRNGEGWVCDRVLEEIQHYKAKIEQASRAGKASAERRSNVGSTDVQLTNNHKPITNNHIKESKDSLSTGLPTCPHQDILNLYKKHLPQLAQPRVWDGVRQTNLRQRWLQAAKPSIFSPKGYSSQAEGLAWWDSFFGYIANDTKLAQGFETKDRTWRPDLVWIVNATNFAKIIDGKYQK